MSEFELMKESFVIDDEATKNPKYYDGTEIEVIRYCAENHIAHKMFVDVHGHHHYEIGGFIDTAKNQYIDLENYRDYLKKLKYSCDTLDIKQDYTQEIDFVTNEEDISSIEEKISSMEKSMKLSFWKKLFCYIYLPYRHKIKKKLEATKIDIETKKKAIEVLKANKEFLRQLLILAGIINEKGEIIE